MNVEFVSYDGEYPNLCRGTLVYKIDGKEYSVENILSSGGYLDGNKNEAVRGKWVICEDFLPEEFQGDARELLSLKLRDVVNDNIPHGCCGGCI